MKHFAEVCTCVCVRACYKESRYTYLFLRNHWVYPALSLWQSVLIICLHRMLLVKATYQHLRVHGLEIQQPCRLKETLNTM